LADGAAASRPDTASGLGPCPEFSGGRSPSVRPRRSPTLRRRSPRGGRGGERRRRVGERRGLTENQAMGHRRARRRAPPGSRRLPEVPTMPVSNEQISEVRAFNRDYTRRIGVLSEGLLDSPYSLTEVRVMYEIAHRPGVVAAQLAGELGLDRGYLSRILRGFEAKGLLARATSAADARRRHLRLTPAGRRGLAP